MIPKRPIEEVDFYKPLDSGLHLTSKIEPWMLRQLLENSYRRCLFIVDAVSHDDNNYYLSFHLQPI